MKDDFGEDAQGEVVFEKPPPRYAHRFPNGWWYRRLEPLLKREGKWARIAELPTKQAAANSVGSLSRRVILIPNPEHRWQFASRTIRDYNEQKMRFVVYARYLGENDADNAS